MERPSVRDIARSCVRYKKLKVSDFYDVQKVKHKLDKSKLTQEAEFPCFSSDTSNNGILGYTNNPEFHILNKDDLYVIFGDHTRTFNITTTDFSVLDNVKVLKPKMNNMNILQYVNTVWRKSIPNLGYARHWSLAKNVELSIPVSMDETPDFEYMEKYIRAIEKLVIKDVIVWKDKIIETIKKEVEGD